MCKSYGFRRKMSCTMFFLSTSRLVYPGGIYPFCLDSQYGMTPYHVLNMAFCVGWYPNTIELRARAQRMSYHLLVQSISCHAMQATSSHARSIMIVMLSTYAMSSHASRDRKTPIPFDKRLSEISKRGAEYQRLPADCAQEMYEKAVETHSVHH